MLMEFAEVRRARFVQLDIGKSLFDEALAIVEGARYFERGDVFAERGELFFLALR